MKFTAFVAVSALAVTATAISNQAREAVDISIQKDKDLLWRYCSQEGQPCDQVSNAVHKASTHLTYPDVGLNTTERNECYQFGGSCQVAKRSAEALASAAAEAYAKANPEARNRWCHLVGEPCIKARDLPAIYRRNANAEPVAEPRNRWCHLVGEPCVRKREPEAEGTLEVRRNRWCHLVGEPCIKVRRSALPAPEPIARNRWCHLVGEPCVKLRRAADEIGTALYQRSAEASPRNRWCHLVGEPCIKARSLDESVSDEDVYLHERCHTSGAPCDIAKRAAEDLAFAADHALEQAGL